MRALADYRLVVSLALSVWCGRPGAQTYPFPTADQISSA